MLVSYTQHYEKSFGTLKINAFIVAYFFVIKYRQQNIALRADRFFSLKHLLVI